MSATRNSQPAERVGGSPNKPEKPVSDGPSFQQLLHAWAESHRTSLIDSLRRLLKQPIGSFFTCLVMAIALSLPMGLSLLLSNVERLGGSWQRAAQISLFLKLEASPAEAQRLRDEIAAMDDVAAARRLHDHASKISRCPTNGCRTVRDHRTRNPKTKFGRQGKLIWLVLSLPYGCGVAEPPRLHAGNSTE